jgi:two-component system alkaline phosphatase synthesis response regulator PhoP
MTDCMRVLVATASTNLQQLICRLLGRSGYNAHPVASAEAAIEAARQSDYRAIVTDMHLPDCCGVTLVDRLRREGVSTPAILLCEEQTPRLREVVTRLGSIRCLTSPSPEQLKEAVSAAATAAQAKDPA